MKYKVSYAEVQGTSHKNNNLPCQDKTAYTKHKNYACVVLADGAGSRQFSHLGADIVTKTVCEYFKVNQSVENFDKYNLMKTINDKLSKSGYIYNDLSSTLLFVFVNNSKCLVGHLGDGMIFCVNNNETQTLSFPENGEEINITYFTTDSDAICHLRYFDFDLDNNKNYTFILVSDGGQTLLFDDSTKVPAKAVQVFANWILSGDEEEVSYALNNVLEELAPTYTSDDVSLIELAVFNDEN